MRRFKPVPMSGASIMSLIRNLHRYLYSVKAPYRDAAERAVSLLGRAPVPPVLIEDNPPPFHAEPVIEPPPPPPPSGITPVHGLAEINRIFAEAAMIDDPIAQIGMLSTYYADIETDMPADPFSPAYRQAVVALYERLTDHQDYQPAKSEVSPGLRAGVGVGQPSPFGVSDSAWVGEGWMAWGFIMQQLRLKPGQKVIEYGAGFGAMAVALARNGCDVTVVDIEPAYLDWIQHQARQVGVTMRTHQGSFGDVPKGSGPFDAVVFLESFHHSLDHAALLIKLRGMTTPDAVVCLGDEPVFEPDDYWARTVPFPWGPRLDLVSVRAGRTMGWLELGFQESYLREAMLRAGWLVKKHVFPLSRRGTCWIGRKMGQSFHLADTDLPDLQGSTWFDGGADGRWTGAVAELPLPISLDYTEVEIDITNHNTLPIPVTVTAADAHDAHTIAPAQTVTFRLPLSPAAARLRISTPGFTPNDTLQNGDTRTLGVYVGGLRFAV
jgi:predicted nicotinamide N-methyase